MANGGRSQLKMSEETFDFVCTACARDNKTVEAVKYCVECSGYCCQPCTDAHKKFPTLTGRHNLMEVSQGNKASGDQSSVLEFPTERCSVHKGKVVDMYCEGHDAVGCYVCIAKDHKSCQDSHIHSIPDMIDTIYKLSDCKQTHMLMKDMMVSMATVSESKDAQLQTLNKAKKETLDTVTTFQKALEAIIRKAAESSRQEVEAAYTELENEMLQEKQDAENIYEDLERIDEKLLQSDGNRAQKFVCSKLGQEKIQEADRVKIKQDSHNTDVQISFIPDQNLIEYVKALQGIGQVKKQQKHALYKIIGSKDIPIKLPNDSITCRSYGCCLTPDNQLLFTDYFNKKLKRFDIQTMSVVDYCSLDSNPNCVCCISKHEVAVACEVPNMVQFISIQDKMIAKRRLELSHCCHGIAFKDSKLYVTDYGESLYVYDMTGILLKTISQDHSGNMLFHVSCQVAFNESGNRMFVGDEKNGLVCFDGMGNHLSSITDSDLGRTEGICADGRGNVFVVGYGSHNVVQFTENGKKVGVVVKEGDGCHSPLSVCFHQGMNRMFVTMQDSNVVKMYELE